MLFFGIDNAGFAPLVWASSSTSFLDVKSLTQRTPIQNSGGAINTCTGWFVLDWNAYQSTHSLALGNLWLVGDKLQMQAWSRDRQAAKFTNLSNAVGMTCAP